jgi:hypothetical protein
MNILSLGVVRVVLYWRTGILYQGAASWRGRTRSAGRPPAGIAWRAPARSAAAVIQVNASRRTLGLEDGGDPAHRRPRRSRGDTDPRAPRWSAPPDDRPWRPGPASSPVAGLTGAGWHGQGVPGEERMTDLTTCVWRVQCWRAQDSKLRRFPDGLQSRAVRTQGAMRLPTSQHCSNPRCWRD